VNDDWRNLSATAAFVDSLGLSRIDVLPYHRAGVAKYQRLGRVYAMTRVNTPSDESLGLAADTMARAGLDVHVGGSA
jgi:pyruvate formate lyase activating enzyme